MVPVATFGSNIAPLLIIIGLVIGFLQLAWVGIILFGAMVLFQLVTLPVEFNASGRAMIQLRTLGIVTTPDEEVGARKMLTAAAMTYVAAAITAILQLLYWISAVNRRRD
jgi:hypothetical protein